MRNGEEWKMEFETGVVLLIAGLCRVYRCVLRLVGAIGAYVPEVLFVSWCLCGYSFRFIRVGSLYNSGPSVGPD